MLSSSALKKAQPAVIELVAPLLLVECAVLEKSSASEPKIKDFSGMDVWPNTDTSLKLLLKLFPGDELALVIKLVTK